MNKVQANCQAITKAICKVAASGRVDQNIAHLIGIVSDRYVFDLFRMALIAEYGMKMPQNINDALTRKHLELKNNEE